MRDGTYGATKSTRADKPPGQGPAETVLLKIIEVPDTNHVRIIKESLAWPHTSQDHPHATSMLARLKADLNRQSEAVNFHLARQTPLSDCSSPAPERTQSQISTFVPVDVMQELVPITVAAKILVHLFF